MAHQSHSIESEALSLPEDRRARLVLKLLESIDRRPSENPKGVERAWLEEANRRYEAYLRGEEEALSAEQVFAELRADDR